jgi:DNA-binding MarR family transcriptional regulator
MSIFRLNGEIVRIGEQIVRPIGQSAARWQVLGRVCLQPQTVADLARDIGHARQSVQRVADALLDEGLLVNRAHPTDKRTKLLAATRKGQQVMGSIYQQQVAWSQEVMTKLNPAQMETLIETLQDIANVLELEYQETPA